MGIRRELGNNLTELSGRLGRLAASVERVADKIEETSVAAKPKRRRRKMTDAERILYILRRNKQGQDIKILVKKTGFNAGKVRRILGKLCNKSGQIKRLRHGVYAPA